MGNTKLAIFDLDGVLIDSKELHFVALNKALSSISPEHVINPSDHATIFDGLSTKRKLMILHEKRNLPVEKFEQISSLKQSLTMGMLGQIGQDLTLKSYLQFLCDRNIILVVASNSIKNTVEMILTKLGVRDFFSLVLSNEDVDSVKPHPEIYWKAMAFFKVLPENTVIFEDSFIGRTAAQRSGARLIPIDNRSDLSWDKIESAAQNKTKGVDVRWKSHSLNVLIPMAGHGSRFESVGYTFPKPLIEVNRKPMIQVVVENLNIDAHFIYIVQKQHFEKYNLDYLLRLITPNCDIVQVDGVTEGAACTTLLAREFINSDNSLLIANSDQYLEWNSGETLYSFMAEGVDGGIVTFRSMHPKWSFVRLDDSGIVVEVAEKKPISDIATAGVYFWRRGSDYVRYAELMIEKNIRTNGEFYVCPVFNQAIEDNKIFRVRDIEKMWGLGTPEDLNYFIENFKDKDALNLP
jgi:beta-phosphoglucomutase-like phosphatase (HAD superfamily)/dTDP-glucose pyrophosphorylase